MPQKSEFIAIKAMCDAFGCGNVMEWVSAIWRHDLAKKGLPTTHADICVVPALCNYPDDAAIRIGEETRQMYDRMVKQFMED